jgi:carboxyl-terminal processing protease
MPDVFVPWDSIQYTDFYVDLLSKGLFNDFVLDYIDRERNVLQGKYPEYKEFNNRFIIDNRFLDEFLAYASSRGVKPLNDELKLSSRLIRYQLKALIGRNLFEFRTYFQVLSEIDDGIQKALEVLRENDYFAGLTTN